MIIFVLVINKLDMGNIKIVLRKKQNKDGLYPLAIRITHNRKSSYIHVGEHIAISDWDEKGNRVRKSHPNSTRLNNLLLKKRVEANDNLYELEANNAVASSAVVKNHLTDNRHSFFGLAEDYIQSLDQAGKHSRVSAEKPRIKHFREFIEGNDIAFKDITPLLLKKFQSYLYSKRKVAERTVVNHLIVIRTIFNLAIREGLVEQKYYPFGRGKVIIKFPESVKLGLNQDELKALEAINLAEGSPRRYALKIWLFSFYMAGMRMSDILRLKWSDMSDGRLYYTMGKNNKTGSLKLPEKALVIVEEMSQYRSETSDLIFLELRGIDPQDTNKIHRNIRTADKKFNKHLKNIAIDLEMDKPLTMHIARHSFGNLSGDKIPLQMLQKLYRHTNITTTINYQSNFIHKDTDEALDSVVGF